MRKKIIMLGVCILVLVGIFIRNMKIGPKDKETLSTGAEVVAEGGLNEGMLRAEAFRLISYLYYTDAERETIEPKVTFEDAQSGEWYDEYVSAIYSAGFENQADSVNGKYYIRPEDELVWHEVEKIFEKVADSFSMQTEDIYTSANIDVQAMNATDHVTRKTFLSMFEAVVGALDEKDALIYEDSLYLLAVQEDGTIVTQKGTYEGAELFYLEDNVEEVTGQNLGNYVDSKLAVLVSGQRIVYVKAIDQDTTVLNNVYLIHGSDNVLTAYVQGITKEFKLVSSLTTDIDQMVGNLTCRNGEVVNISLKPDVVTDKVLVANDKYIELENYGKVEYDSDFAIYKVYGELSMEKTNAILVGYSNTQFVLTDNKISAALITEPITVQNIRVMLKTSKYKSLFHEEVTFTCDKAFTIYYGDESKSIKAKKEITLNQDSKYMKEGRVKIVADDGETPIQILSIKRSQGAPYYRGSIEIASTDEGIVVINELPIEEYLYAVLPSEMPASYGSEALKTQAVCARSYAYKQLLENNYSEYGAQIDDSSAYQVYNNYAETEETIEAVKATYGQVIEYQGSVITAYYFSTSCGYTSSIADVWSGSEENAYLVGSFQTVDGLTNIQNASEDAQGDEAVETMANTSVMPDFSEESLFRDFLNSSSYEMLEESFPWYRWEAKLSYEQITKNIDEKIAQRYEANPLLILTERTVDGEVTYVSEPITSIGTVTGLEVKERKKSGIVTQLLIHGEDATVLVKTEYNIRALLAPGSSANVIRQDESEVENLSLLPSAFFVFDETKNGVKISGGGYGHGVGMSQNGVKALADLGYDYEAIIEYYYQGTMISSIY